MWGGWALISRPGLKIQVSPILSIQEPLFRKGESCTCPLKTKWGLYSAMEALSCASPKCVLPVQLTGEASGGA